MELDEAKSVPESSESEDSGTDQIIIITGKRRDSIYQLTLDS